jgi:hypothetical protein
MEWIEFNKKKETKKNVRPNSTTGQQNRTTDIKRKVDREDKTIYTTVVHNKSES